MLLMIPRWDGHDLHRLGPAFIVQLTSFRNQWQDIVGLAGVHSVASKDACDANASDK